MKLEDTIAKSIFEYPTLFKDYTLEKSRIKVLDHLFFTLGNGFEWFDGYLAARTELDPKTHQERVVKKFKKYGKEKFKWRPTQEWFDEKIYSDAFEKMPKVLRELFEKEIEKNPKFKDINFIEDRSTYEPRPYPLCEEVSMIFEAPKDIRPDWLAGAIEAMEWGLKFWQEPPPLVAKSEFIRQQKLEEAAIIRVTTEQQRLICKALEHLKAIGQK